MPNDELNTALAEQMVAENRRLSTENQELLSLNESMNAMMVRLEALGGLDHIEEALKGRTPEDDDILESMTRTIENYGSLDIIDEAMRQQAEFTEKHGSFEAIEEALTNSHAQLTRVKELVEKHGTLDQIDEALTAGSEKLASLDAFVEANGTLDEVSESMAKIEERLPLINEGLQLAKDAREFQEKYGTFSEIAEALTRSHRILKGQADKIEESKFAEVCESIKIDPAKARDLMKKHEIELSELKDLCESLGFKGEPSTSIDESKTQKVEKKVRGRHFLEMTRDKSQKVEGNDINENKQSSTDPFRSRSRLERMIGD